MKTQSTDSFLWLLVAALLMVVVFALCSCHTVSGIGKDLQAVSEPYIQEDKP